MVIISVMNISCSERGGRKELFLETLLFSLDRVALIVYGQMDGDQDGRLLPSATGQRDPPDRGLSFLRNDATMRYVDMRLMKSLRVAAQDAQRVGDLLIAR